MAGLISPPPTDAIQAGIGMVHQHLLIHFYRHGKCYAWTEYEVR